MPSNPYKEELRCRQAIDEMIRETLPEAGRMDYAELKRQILIQFMVSEGMVDRFVREYYVENGYATLEDGILKPGEAEK